MNLKKPDLNLSRPDLPGFVPDLYRDLRDRRLLPFVALLIVATIAVPFAFGAKPKGEAPAEAQSPVEALKEATAHTSALTVVQATPGLRDYHRRLGSRSPTNPFVQRYTGSDLKGAHLHQPTTSTTGGGSGGESTSTTGGGSTSTTEAGSPAEATLPPSEPSGGAPGGSEGGAPGGSGGGAGGGQGGSGQGGSGGGGEATPPVGSATLYTVAVDVKIVHSSGSKADGDKKAGKPETRTEVLPTTPLPGKKNEVVNYLGLSPKTKAPLFLVSTDVTSEFGEASCVSGSDTCQLIELEAGFPETFVYGEGGDRYKITVTGVELVPVGKAASHAQTP